MNNTLKIFLLIFGCLIFSSSNLLAQQNNAQDTLIVDKGQIEIYKKDIDNAKIENYRQQKDFNYEYSEVENIGFFDKIKLMIQRWLALLSKSLGVIWYLRYFIAGGIIVFLIVIIAKSNSSGLFRPHQKVISIPFSDQVNPESINWEEEIKKALLNHEFRLAVRYQFLSALKSLSKNDVIIWKSEKTNYDYLNEIKDNQLKKQFGELSKLYEAIWYGNFPIVQEEYASIGRDFEQFNTNFNAKIK